ncbi:MAG: hypothetical protein QXK24_01390 [Ignisphaera sp.]
MVRQYFSLTSLKAQISNTNLRKRTVVMEPEEPRDKIDQVFEDMHKWRRKSWTRDLTEKVLSKSWQYYLQNPYIILLSVF